ERFGDDLLAVAPESDLPHLVRGHQAAEKRRYRRAARHFEQAARLNPQSPAIAQKVQATKVLGHPVLAPVRPVWRFGRRRSWLLYIAIIVLLVALHQTTLRIIVICIWVLIVILSWTAPRLLRRWYGRRRRAFSAR